MFSSKYKISAWTSGGCLVSSYSSFFPFQCFLSSVNYIPSVLTFPATVPFQSSSFRSFFCYELHLFCLFLRLSHLFSRVTPHPSTASCSPVLSHISSGHIWPISRDTAAMWMMGDTFLGISNAAAANFDVAIAEIWVCVQKQQLSETSVDVSSYRRIIVTRSQWTTVMSDVLLSVCNSPR